MTLVMVFGAPMVFAQQDPSRIQARPLDQDGKPLIAETPDVPDKEDLLAYADLLYSHKQYPLAARQYQLFLKDHPNSPNVQAGWFRLGECYLQVGQDSDAKTTFIYVVDKYKEGPFAGSAAYRLAVMNYNAKNYLEAGKLFAIAAQHLSSAEAALQASFYGARCLQFLDKPEEAIAAYEAVMKKEAPEGDEDWKNPFRERCLLEMARLHYDLGEAEAAFAKFEELAKTAESPEYREEALARAGLLAAEMGNAEKSNEYLDQALKLGGDSPWKSLATVGLIFNHFAREEYGDVLKIYAGGVYDAPSDVRPKMLLVVGHSYRLTDNLDSAIEIYELVEQNFRDQPEGSEAGYRKLQCLHQRDDGGLAVYIDQYLAQQRMIDLKSEFIDLALLMKAEWNFNRAQVATSRGQNEQAIEHYAEAAQAYGAVREAKVPEKYHEARLYKLGWSQVESGNDAAGVTTLGSFIRRFQESPLVPSALAKRAATYQSTDDFTAALTDYRRITDAHADAPEVEFALQQIALIHGNRREIPEMVEAYETLLEKFPDTLGAAEAHYWIGVGLFDQEKYEEALVPLEKARTMDPEHYAAKGSLRIILAHYQLQDLESLAEEAEAYLDGGKKGEPEGSGDDEKPAVARPMDDDRPAIPPQVLTYLGQRLFEEKDFVRAEKFLTAASDPERPAYTSSDVWDLLGQSRMELKKYAEAIGPWEHYLSMTQRPTDRGRAYLALGQASLALGEGEKARENARECLKTIKQGRVNARARILLGDVAASEGDMAGAAREYLVVSQIFIDDEITPIALQKAVKAYRLAGEDAKANELEQQLRTSFPNARETAPGAE